MATYGKGLSGGDRIWIEIVKQLKDKYQTSIYLWEEGKVIAEREGLNKNFVLWSAKKWARFGFIINYFARICISIFNSLVLKIDNSPETIVYSASEFWQDSLPAVILKLRYPKIKWVAAWYQTAQNPFYGFRLRTFLYWLVQQPIKPLICKFSDLVIVNNESEREEFPMLNQKNKVFVILGGIDLEKINQYRKQYKNIKKIYDGVFQGRFHPQKGVVELIDIWKAVVVKKPDSKLAMIGDGSLMNEVRKKIKDNHLENNVILFGYLFDGPLKYKIFAQSKIVVHPALYDSGGMAAGEAMIFGLPAVGFNLPAYDSYYPEGLVKVSLGDLGEFAQKVLELLDKPYLRQNIGKKGVEMLEKNWSWKIKTENLVKFIL